MVRCCRYKNARREVSEAATCRRQDPLRAPTLAVSAPPTPFIGVGGASLYVAADFTSLSFSLSLSLSIYRRNITSLSAKEWNDFRCV